MGGDAMYRVIQRTRAEGITLNVLLALASWADGEGWCYPSVLQIAGRAHCGRKSVFRALARLQQLGELEIHSRGHNQRDPIRDRGGKAGGFQATNYYRLVVIAPLAKVPGKGGVMVTLPAPSQMSQGGVIRDAKVVSTAAPTPITTSQGSSQKVEQGAAAPDSPERRKGESEKDPRDPLTYVSLLTKVVHELLDRHPKQTDGALREDVSRWAARRHIPYSTESVRRAVDSAYWQRTNLKPAKGQ